MDNRRQYYRLDLAHAATLQVTLHLAKDGPGVHVAIVNLSIGGMCVRLEGQPPNASRLYATLDFGRDEVLTVAVERVYSREDEPHCYGFRFLQPVLRHQQERQEHLIWKYLLEQQRQQRGSLRGGTPPVLSDSGG